MRDKRERARAWGSPDPTGHLPWESRGEGRRRLAGRGRPIPLPCWDRRRWATKAPVQTPRGPEGGSWHRALGSGSSLCRSLVTRGHAGQPHTCGHPPTHRALRLTCLHCSWLRLSPGPSPISARSSWSKAPGVTPPLAHPASPFPAPCSHLGPECDPSWGPWAWGPGVLPGLLHWHEVSGVPSGTALCERTATHTCGRVACGLA